LLEATCAGDTQPPVQAALAGRPWETLWCQSWQYTLLMAHPE
jgi:hypothetical protein